MDEEPICQTCKHYRQHYVKFGPDQFWVCSSGHCVYPRRKLRYGDTKACQHYVFKEAEKDVEAEQTKTDG